MGPFIALHTFIPRSLVGFAALDSKSKIAHPCIYEYSYMYSTVTSTEVTVKVYLNHGPAGPEHFCLEQQTVY